MVEPFELKKRMGLFYAPIGDIIVEVDCLFGLTKWDGRVILDFPPESLRKPADWRAFFKSEVVFLILMTKVSCKMLVIYRSYSINKGPDPFFTISHTIIKNDAVYSVS